MGNAMDKASVAPTLGINIPKIGKLTHYLHLALLNRQIRYESSLMSQISNSIICLFLFVILYKIQYYTTKIHNNK